jgi:GT2 family glycosyltransferase
MIKGGLVGITIVTCNSARLIRGCLQYALEQEYPHLEVIVVDNASTDETRDILRELENRVRVACNAENTGFAAGQNQAIGLSKAEWILALNPDVRLAPDFVSRVVAAGRMDERIGSVSGKILAMQSDFEIPKQPVLDSTGIYFTPALRHFDRGSKCTDAGQYENCEYVFGVTGAAAFYRRKMIEDISIFGEFFDSDFFAYREDADVAWRAQLLGWKCLYTPHALAYHVRSVLPSNRSSVAAMINMHSVKNRFLMRIKNVTASLYFRHFIAITLRDALVVGACVLREHSSLRAFALVLRMLRRTWAKRQEIMRRRVSTDVSINAWFSNVPVSYPAPEMEQKKPTAAAQNR